ncbi:YtxH domain-containing protein [Lentilactobacillus kribbianus]|uniref:YtxH domain-containing protein n=1 Tax=Lentilactobacillus kribbianus TaxID=2729622 RepID=UPI001553DF59|nr:YtxH domain-containing protein [Lentilactobacillus kribbianus]
MGKKLFGGLFIAALGAGAYAAYQKMDSEKKARLQQDVMNKTNDLKDRATDYAFYASDALDDLKEVVMDQIDSTKEQIKDWQAAKVEAEADNSDADSQTQFRAAQERLREELSADIVDDKVEKAEDDIVMTADEALKNQHLDEKKAAEEVKEDKTDSNK